MTPKSFARTPSVNAEDVSETATSELDSGDESLPPHTSEIGTLKKLPNHGTAWLGSSSGVYFVNTVRRAFSAALVDANTSTAIPASEDILTGEDADGRNYNGPVTDGLTVTDGDFRRVALASLGRPPPDRALAMELVTTFFRCWHPLFPFMHGPRFLQDIESIYAMPDVTTTSTFTPAESRRLATFQLIVNIASLDRRDLHLPVESRIKSTSDVTRVAGCFSVNHDIAAIQLLIAAELYLVATIALRRASTVAGMILKLVYHAGLHRCPLRYASLSIEDCEIRKRIFWSAYALDRYLSLSLGDPNTVQDNDIDVCLSGRELHKAVAHELIMDPRDEIKMHLPRPQAGPHGSGSPSDDPRVFSLNEGPQAREKAQREAAMTAYVHYGKLTGQIIEIFHKSIHARFQKPDAITFLNSDIETWWNDLPVSLTSGGSEIEPDIPFSQTHSTNNNSSSQHNDTSNQSSATNPAPTHQQLAPFFLILYHQLQLLLNRPRLSLDQSTAEFQHGLQICIKASRGTLTALKKHRDNGQSMLLPGLLSATWMAGLITAFACQLGKYPKTRACSDISSCLTILESMGCSHWFTVKNCHKVLSLLLENIKSRKASASGFLSAAQAQQRAEAAMAAAAAAQGISRKRMHDQVQNLSKSHISSTPKPKSIGETSSTSPADYSMPPPQTTGPRTPGSTPTTAASSKRQRRSSKRGGWSRSTNNDSDTNNDNRLGLNAESNSNISSQQPQFSDHNDWQANTTANLNPNAHPSMHSNTSDTHNPQITTSANNITSQIPSNISGSALYADPMDISLAQQSHSLDPNLNLDSSSNTQPQPDPASSDTFSTDAFSTSLNIDDPLFWGNFDYNISDIFGAASWENMTGGGDSGLGGNGLWMGWGDLFGGGAGGGGI